MSDKNLPPTSRSSFEWDGTKIKKFIGKETEVVIPEGTTEIGWYAFEGCSSLKSVVIPFSVTVIGNSAFKDCTSLTSVLIPEGVLGGHTTSELLLLWHQWLGHRIGLL